MEGSKLFTILVVVLSLTCLSSIMCGVIENNETSDIDYFGIHIYPVERHCAMVGGLCVHRDDCEPGHMTSTKGLCRNNRHLGVECCYAVIQREGTCRQHLGECMSHCNSDLIQHLATDCPADTKCCIVV